MPFISFELDVSGRPMLRLAISISSTERVTSAKETNLLALSVDALIDSGASRSQVAVSKFLELDLVAAGEDEVHTASTGDAPVKMDRYLVDLFSKATNPDS